MNATRFDDLANAPFEEGHPTAETARTLRDELLFQRATQAYLWALPLINTLGMKVGSERVFGAGYEVLPIWKKRLDAKTQVTSQLRRPLRDELRRSRQGRSAGEGSAATVRGRTTSSSSCACIPTADG
jgi:hypothetical protein